jgi:hypothetical protein
MESPLNTVQFLQMAGWLGLPVHVALALLTATLLRRRLRLSWLRICLAVGLVLASSLCLQVAGWAIGPELPESVFMLFGFINAHALIGACLIFSALVLIVSRRLTASASPAA